MRRFALRQFFQIAAGAEFRRQINLEGAPRAHLTGQIHESPITLDDATGGGETQAGSFTDILVAAEVAIDEVAEMQSGLGLRRSGLQAREADRG
jgi:hypothetical protein